MITTHVILKQALSLVYQLFADKNKSLSKQTDRQSDFVGVQIRCPNMAWLVLVFSRHCFLTLLLKLIIIVFGSRYCEVRWETHG